MESVMRQLNDSVSGIENWFLFKTYDEVNSGGHFKNAVFQSFKKKNFFESWRTSNGERISLYYLNVNKWYNMLIINRKKIN